jgi:hypothetical protein
LRIQDSACAVLTNFSEVKHHCSSVRKALTLMIHEIGRQNSVFNQFIREIRDETIQKDRMRFRRNLERMGEVMAYELSKVLIIPKP